MTAAGSGDAWRISGEDRAKHDSQFFSLKPINGYITGEQARGFFMQSGLPTPILGQIWSLADMNNDGKMDKKEFSIAMHLIKKRLQGYEIPKSLPPSLRADPSPVMGSFGTMGTQPSVMGMPAMGMPTTIGMAPRMPMMANGMAPMVPTSGFAGGVPVSTGFSVQPRPQGVPAASGVGIGMPHGSKLKYTQLFNSHDHHKRGTLTGVEARSILMSTGVPQQMLAQIWNLSDIDKDGKLDCDEFCIAIHLTDLVKMGQMLPAKLPAELMPNKVRSGSFGPPPPVSTAVAPGPPKDNFGDLLGTMGMPPPVQPAPVTNGDAAKMIDDQVTFEDRRKENFDKGQAELERRRQMLQDQMQREQNARLQKEREEQEKREKIRREQELKKQQALERQLEKQREIERQKEEQRQKMMDQREAARRELERQRQMEWERQRKEQLMAEKTREYEQLTSLKARSSNLKCELESLQGKKTETNLKISQVKNGVNDLTAHIEAMRSTRDLKNKDIDRLQAEIQEYNQKLQTVQASKNTLDLKAQTSIQSNPMSETHRTMMHSVELKKTSVQRLKKDLEGIEKDTGIKLADIDVLNTQNSDLQKLVSKCQADLSEVERKKKDGAKISLEQTQKDKEKQEKLRKELESQRLREETQKKEVEASKDTDSKWFDFGGDVKTAAATNNDNWASVFDTQAVSQTSTVAWDSAFSSQKPEIKRSESSNFKLSGPKKKHRALYQFDARNPDELSMMPGDIVMVFEDQTGAEPDWIGGELNGKRGWFPEAYVEKVVEEESSQSLFGTTDISSGGLSSSEDSSFMAVPGKVPAVSPTPGQGQTAPDGLQAQALYPWKAKKDNHLTFNKGDIINVKEQQDMWWSGEFSGKTGWFPKSYVRMVTGPSLNTRISLADSSSPMTVIEKSGSARESPAIDQIQPVNPVLDTSENMYVAVYTYQSTEPDDLTFNQGDIIMVTQTDGDWWTGSLGEKTGIFPANYVKKQEVQSMSEGADPFPAADAFQQSAFADPLTTDPCPVSVSEPVVDMAHVDSPPSGQSSTAEAQNVNLSFDVNAFALNDASNMKAAGGSGTLKKPEIATVIASYTATGNEQLSLNPGQLIQVRKKSPSGWWEGELQARGQKRKIGWFPANYVKLLGSSARNTPDNTLTNEASPSSTMFINANPAPASQSTTPQPISQTIIDHVIALYPYAAQNPDELTFQKDTVINVTKKTDPDWWQGECNGESGMFPSNYVTSTSPESTSWSSDPQVIATTSTEESKRQSYIHELINTEESYMKDMSIVLEAFYKPLAESGALSEEHLKNIFVNWKELIVCNTKLQKALRVRKKMCGDGQVINSIGDILCENIPHLTPYIRFCSCQLNAAALLQRISENNSLFNEVHKKCVQNPKTKGMPMSSFLLKPMQRITKYPLIVEKILNYTPESHPDNSHLREALEHCQELCSQVNEGVREKENSDRLEWIQQHVHCDGLPEKITFNSVTNCLGPRKILHTGVVFKIKSNKELGAFLFNDFLLLTTANRPLSNATHSLFDVTGQVQYKMYKSPVVLNEVMIKKHENPEDDSFVVSHIDRVFHLRCSSKADRDVWLRKLTTASTHYLDTIKKKREKAHSSPKHSRGVGRLLVIILEGINLICSKDVRRSPGVGRLLVVIIEGKDLQSSDDHGKSDPYCEVSMGAQEHKTKVINNSLNPKWNASMQFIVKDLSMDALCITVFDRDLFSPNDFLGRTEIRIQDILKEAGGSGGPRQPLIKHLVLHEVPTGEIVVKLDLHLFDQT